MTITVTRDRTGKMRHIVAVRNHRFPVDVAQCEELRNVAGKCPVHRLMTQVTTEIATELASASP